MSFNKTKLALAVAAGLAVAPAAFATNGIMQVGNGMAAHGLGGASLSNANEAMSGFDNPALITDTGDAISMGFSIFMPDRQAEALGGLIVDKSVNNMYAIPQVAFTSKVSNSMSWGIMVNALGGMDTTFVSGTLMPQSQADLSGMIIAPTLGFAIGKNASVGASLLIGYENFRAMNLMGMGYFDEGTAMGYGVKLGGNFKVNDGMAFSLVLQPKMSMGEINNFKNFLGMFGFTGDAALTLPNIVGVGGKFAVGKNMDIVADIMQYQWSSVDVFDFFGWQDQTVLKVGAEWRATDKLALRAGINYGKSPIQGDVAVIGGTTSAVEANASFPAVSEQHVTLGMGYKMDKNMTVNAYYLHSPRTTIEDATGLAPTFAISMAQNAFGLGINYQSK